MIKISLLFALILTTFSYAQDSISVLFIGNSYTYVNDLPTVFSNLTISLGDEVTIDSKTNGGYTFQNHLLDPLTHTKIQSKPWDFVVLQGQSQEPSFPTDQVNLNTLPPAVSLADSVYSNRYCSQAMYFMSWGRQVGDPQWDSINTFDKMNARLRNAYVRITDSAQACVAPVGVAWKYVRDNNPTINLYAGDGSHPSLEGTYLAACTFYASVFRKTPVGASYTAGLDLITAGILQEAAAIAVLDSLETWHLRATEDISIANFHYTITGNEVQFTNDSWRSTDYEWSFGDATTSVIIDPTHVFSADGTYTVQLIAASACGDDTISYEIIIDIAQMDEAQNDVVLKKMLGQGQFEISLLNNTELNSYVLVDAVGKVLKNEWLKNDSNTLLINLKDFPNGLYFLKMSTNKGEVTIELPKFE